MSLFKSNSIDFITSSFTRKQGYTNVKSSKKYSHKEAIDILNSFTPQGASPRISLRIGKYKGKTGVGYYFMESDELAKISTVLLEGQNHLKIPIDEDSIRDIADGDHTVFLSSKNYNETFSQSIKFNQFSNDKLSGIVYSLLAGDNIILVHPRHEIRLEFIKNLLYLLPSIFFKYNRITSGCDELDGNENIVGVASLPRQYRSHKKLYLPLDTIFIDLENKVVEGEGLKKCSLTNKISSILKNDIERGQEKIFEFFNILDQEVIKLDKFDKPTITLINQIRSKLGLEASKDNNWLMTF